MGLGEQHNKHAEFQLLLNISPRDSSLTHRYEWFKAECTL